MIAALGAPPKSLERDLERVEAMQARNLSRANRFLDARQRTIGIDMVALEAQKREHREREGKERAAKMAEFRRNERVYEQIALQEAEESHLRGKELADIRATWMEQMRRKKEKEQKERDDILGGVDFGACGSSALQIMAGEDPNKPSRVEQQRKQMREWHTRQMEDRRAREAGEDNDMDTYRAYLERVNEMQEQLLTEEQTARKDLNERIKEENRTTALEKARERARRKQLENEADARELSYRTKFLKEREGHQDRASSGAGATGQYKSRGGEAVTQANAKILEEKSLKAKREREEQADWHMRQEQIREAKEKADQEERCRVNCERVSILRDLQEQRRENHQRTMKDREGRFGTIDFTHGMYAGFGKCCR